MAKSILDIMAQATATWAERDKIYGDSYKRHGNVMKALLPKGIELNSIDDFNRFGTLNMIVSKLVRYTQNWYEPHIDSIHDMGVYCFINQHLDEEVLEKTPPKANKAGIFTFKESQQ